MSEYAQRFAQDRINFSVLPELTDQHLKDLRIALGARLKMLAAIRDLIALSIPASPHPAKTAPNGQDTADPAPPPIPAAARAIGRAARRNSDETRSYLIWRTQRLVLELSRAKQVQIEGRRRHLQTGDAGRELFIIKSGKVETRIGNRVLDTFSAGNIFGEMALINSAPRNATRGDN